MTARPDWRSLYPFASHYLEIGGFRYHYLDEGTGPTLLLVHGNPTWSFYWRNIVLAFRGRYRLVVPDHIGCGLSDKPGRHEYPYHLQRRIDDLVALVEQLGLQQITLVAHDWGGAIGLGAAVARPDRFRRFVLLNTAAFRSNLIPRRIAFCRIPWLGRLAMQGGNLFARAAVRMASAKPERITPAVAAGLLAPYDSWAHRVAVAGFVNDIPLTTRHPSYATLCAVEQGLSTLRGPVSLIWGMRDWCFGAPFLERFLEFFPSADVHRLADAGHYVIEDAHEQIIPIVNAFLDRHPL